MHQGKDTLAIYSFIFGPERERPCPGSTHFLDGLDGTSRHIDQRINLAVVAKSPLPRILSFAKERGWRWLQLLSTAGNAYDRGYFGDDGSRSPRTEATGIQGRPGVRYAYTEWVRPWPWWDRSLLDSEPLYMPPEPGQKYRHNDLLDPVWTMSDLAPEGRGDFQSKLGYMSGSGK